MPTTGVKAGGSTNRFVLGYIPENDWGVTPAGNYSGFRLTGESLGVDEATTESEEIRPDRQTTDLIRTQFDATGSVDVEWSRDSYDPFIESVMENPFSTKVDLTTTLSFVAVSKTVTDDDISGAFADVSIGDIIRIGGTVANNGNYRVVTKADDNTITVFEAVVDEAGAGIETVEGSSVRNGITQCTFSLYGGQTDVDVYKVLTGMSVGSMSVSVAVGEVVTGSFDFMGKSVTFSTTAPTVDDAPDTRVFDSINNFGDLKIGGVTAGNLTSVSLDVTDNNEMQRVIGTYDSAGIRDGRFGATGSFTAYLADSTLLDSFVDQTELSIQFELIDTDGYGYVFLMPRVRLSNAQMVADGGDNDAVVTFDYTALKDTTLDYTLQITRFTDAV